MLLVITRDVKGFFSLILVLFLHVDLHILLFPFIS